MTRLVGFLLTFLCIVFLPPQGQGSVDPIFGYWQTAESRAIIEIEPCGAKACGRMVWVREPLDESGRPKRDVQGQQLCGLRLVSGLQRADAGLWEDGRIYNPRNGRTYSAKVEALAEDRIEVRGYAGVPLFGRSQVWTRADGDRGGC